MGSTELVAFAAPLRGAVGTHVQLDISIRTNGLLLTQEALDALSSAAIGISLSLDGPKRRMICIARRRGRSSFEQTYRALQLLRSAPDVFAGVIAVIDPRTQPAATAGFLQQTAGAAPGLPFAGCTPPAPAARAAEPTQTCMRSG